MPFKNEAVLYYKNGGNNADKDSLFLILTPVLTLHKSRICNLLMLLLSWNL